MTTLIIIASVAINIALMRAWQLARKNRASVESLAYSWKQYALECETLASALIRENESLISENDSLIDYVEYLESEPLINVS